MTRNLRIYLLSSVLMACNQLYSQAFLDRANRSLSPTETRFHANNADFALAGAKTAYANPAFTRWNNVNDTTTHRRSAIVYAGLAGADGKGDFIPYEGSGSTDYRAGAYGEYDTPKSGTLSGCIQYAQGKHRHIGWSAMRLPELYLPYISTDSCGGDFKFDTYFAEGNYAFTLNQWTLGMKASFYGEQAYRLTDPRALNNTTWLRFNAGVARHLGHHLLLLDAGYGRNKQHMRLRYWRPGQQDRFFVCYGFGLYDTRQSTVSFGKSRMYYVDEFNARLQYLSTQAGPLRIHAALGYAFAHMKTEESDIYNLYESRSHRLSPLLRLTYAFRGDWQLELAATGDIMLRKGYENIIEEYLIDRENNIYDFRTIDTRQHYSCNTGRFSGALKASKRLARFEISLQGGATMELFEEKYKANNHKIRVRTLTPHVKLGIDRQGIRDDIGLSLLFARQHVADHVYDVVLQHGGIERLDFQHAFAPYAFRCAELHEIAVDITWLHRLKKMDVGLNAKLYLADGDRKSDVSYSGTIGFPATAPMLKPMPDKHQERWAALTAFVSF